VDFGGVPKYQDVSFNVNLPIKDNQQISIFGPGGISSIIGEQAFESGEPAYRGIFDSDLGVLGICHLYFFGERASNKNTISLSGTRLRARDEFTDDQGEFYETFGSQIDKSTILTLSTTNGIVKTKLRPG
jgi:hypothetical protein